MGARNRGGKYPMAIQENLQQFKTRRNCLNSTYFDGGKHGYFLVFTIFGVGGDRRLGAL